MKFLAPQDESNLVKTKCIELHFAIITGDTEHGKEKSYELFTKLRCITEAKKENLKGILNHHFRDVLEKNGITLKHSNENIDSTRTQNNITMYFNQKEQTFLPCTDIQQIEDSLQTRLGTVRKPLRRDAVLCRGIILQLAPEFYETASNKEQSYFDMLEWATKTFNSKNLIGISIHDDESNPHIHIMFTPVTEDGRLSQKDWFKDPDTLRAMHEDFRNHMRRKGYDISKDKKPPRKHLAENDYKVLKSAEEKVQALKSWEQDLRQRTNSIVKRENTATELERTLDAKEVNLAQYECLGVDFLSRAKKSATT